MSTCTFSSVDAASQQPSQDSLAGLPQGPILTWAVVLMAAMLCYFVHILNGQVVRGEQFRAEQRAQSVAVVAKRTQMSKKRPQQMAAAQP